MNDFLISVLLDLGRGAFISVISLFTCWLFFSKRLKHLEENALNKFQKEQIFKFMDRNEFELMFLPSRLNKLEKDIMDIKINIDDTQEKQSIRDRLLVLETLEKKR